ncbi:MAG TPA: diaminopimelate epimerase [Buchnera sp. (in: enterobacteria)]|nr:diaminopimelate epimerase [Buchnera sp. (in: enterobacteria)]
MLFSKMHGLGNDFVIIENITQNISYFPYKAISTLSDRKLGIGFDQLLLIERSNVTNIDFHYRIFNANGIEVTQCGNGARCIAHFLSLKGLTQKTEIHISTINRKMVLQILENNNIKVNMGEPNFNLHDIPCLLKKNSDFYSIAVLNQTLKFGIVSMGNPHCTTIIDHLHNSIIESIGPIIATHELFPTGINVGFMEIIQDNYISLRVYERDVGETQACGSGACAAVAIGIKNKILNKTTKVKLLGGYLSISWKGPGTPMYMIGPSVHVYDGIIKI